MSRNPRHELLKQARKGHLGRIDRLLGRGVDVNCQGKFGQTALFEAALMGRVEAVRFLLNHGARPGVLSNDGSGPLFFACARGYLEIVDLLIEQGADVNACRRTDLRHGTEFSSPLEVAISNRHDAIARKLVDSGANLDHRVRGVNMLEYAARQGFEELVDYLKGQRSGGDRLVLTFHARSKLTPLGSSKPGTSWSPSRHFATACWSAACPRCGAAVFARVRAWRPCSTTVRFGSNSTCPRDSTSHSWIAEGRPGGRSAADRLTRRAAAEVCQVMDLQACGDLA